MHLRRTDQRESEKPSSGHPATVRRVITMEISASSVSDNASSSLLRRWWRPCQAKVRSTTRHSASGAPHHRHGAVESRRHPRHQAAGVPGLSPYQPRYREPIGEALQDRHRIVPVRDSRRMDHHPRERFAGVTLLVPLAAAHLLAPVKAVRPPFSWPVPTGYRGPPHHVGPAARQAGMRRGSWDRSRVPPRCHCQNEASSVGQDGEPSSRYHHGQPRRGTWHMPLTGSRLACWRG